MPRVSHDYADLDRECFSLLAKRGFTPHVIFDVGASNGYWSHNIQSIFPSAEFHLFEPLIAHSPEYKSLMDYHLQTYPNFTLHQVALGETDGDVPIHIFPSPFDSTTLNIEDDTYGTKTVIIPILTLETAIKILHLPIPQVIKIDTQGNELAILKGGKEYLSKVDVLVLETWLRRGFGSEPPLLHELMSWLLPYNFHLWDIADSYRDEDDVLTSVDCFFINANAGLTPQWFY